MHREIKKLTTGIEEHKKTLATLLAKILNPNVIIPSGFSVGTDSFQSPLGTPECCLTPVITPRSFNTPMPTIVADVSTPPAITSLYRVQWFSIRILKAINQDI